MSGSNESDTLMYIVQAAGTEPLAAESSASLVSTDKLLAGFKAGGFFEINSFAFAMDLSDDEGGGAGAPGARTPQERGSYARWRALGESTAKPAPPFLATAQDVSFSRKMDKSSSELMKHCLDNKRFDTAVVVRRSRHGTEGTLSVFLRLEFRKVRIKALRWEDGDIVKEICKFDFETMKGTYVKRNPDGTPAANWPLAWSKAPNA